MSSGSVISSYYVQVATGSDYGPDEYTEAANKLLTACKSVLCSQSELRPMIDGPIDSCNVSIEISCQGEPRELQAACVLDMTSSQKLKLDKGRLTKALKSSEHMAEWAEACKISKKAVPA